MSGRRETKDYGQEDDGLAEAEQGGGWSVDQDRGGGSATDMEVILQRLGSKEYRRLLEAELEASRRGEGDLGRIEGIVAALAAVDGEEGGDERTVDELYLAAIADQRQEQAFLSRQGEGGEGGHEVIGDIDLLAAAAFADEEQQHKRDEEDPKALALQLVTAAAARGEGRYNPFATHQHHRQQEEGVVDRRVRRNPFEAFSPPMSPMVASSSNGVDQSGSESSSPFLLHRGRELMVGDEEDEEETEDDEDGFGTQPVPRRRGSIGDRGEEMIIQERQQQQEEHRSLLLTQYLLERQQQQQELFQQGDREEGEEEGLQRGANKSLLLTQYLLERQQHQQELFQHCDGGKGEEDRQQQDTSRSLLLTQYLLERQQHQQELFQQCHHEEAEGEEGRLVGGEVGSPAIAWEEEGRDDEVVVSRRGGGGGGRFDRTYDIVDEDSEEEGEEEGMILKLESVIRQGRGRIGGSQGKGQDKGEGEGLIGAFEQQQQEHYRRRSSGGPSPPPPFATVDWSAPSPPVPIFTKNYSYQRKGLIRGGQAVMTPRGRTNHSDSPSYQAFIERQEFMEETRRSKLKALRQQRDQEVDKSSNTGRWLSRTPTGKALRESQSLPTDPYNDGMTSSYHRRTASSGSQERGRKERMNPVADCFLERLHRQIRARHEKLERIRTEVLAAR